MKEAIVLVFLGINAWTDLRSRQVSAAAIGSFGLGALVWRIYTGQISPELLVPAGIGCLFLALSIWTKGAVGFGDGLLILALGAALEMDDFLAALLTGLLISALWSGILLSVFRKGKKTEIPFAPFLLLGYVGGVLWWK